MMSNGNRALSSEQLLASAQLIASYNNNTTSTTKRVTIMNVPFPNGVVAIGSLFDLVSMRDWIAFSLSASRENVGRVFFIEPCKVKAGSSSSLFTYRLCCRVNANSAVS
jgi:hypothetical protein